MGKLGRVDEPIEDKSLAFRELVERSYKNDPTKTDSELVYMGYWRIASSASVSPPRLSTPRTTTA